MSFDSFLKETLLDESINDKGILKAVFILGIPGSGKSYTVSQLKGSISPRIVNTDIMLEYLSHKKGIEANSKTWKEVFRDDTKRITSTMLYNYINGMLPLFVDGTSNDASNILNRVGILESLGYDVGCIFIHTDLDVAKKRAVDRAAKIGRSVDESFIEKVYKESEANKKYFESKFGYFKIYNNNGNDLDNSVMNKLFASVQEFYDADVINPVGKRIIERLTDNTEKYIVPSIYEDVVLKNKLKAWYKT